MSRYYTGRRAQSYNRRWRNYTRRTLTQALAMIDVDALHSVKTRLGRPARVLDVACGTGILLKQLLEQVPDAQAYGVDASADMLAQARTTLKDWPGVQLEQAEVGSGETADLPYRPGTFDLITCTNALHDLPDPVATLSGLRRLLSPGGQLVVEDFARREPPFPWAAFEWLMKRIEGGKVHAFRLAEARSLCARAGLRVVCEKTFSIDWLWRGWALRAYDASSG
jgi:ubiquinone/menaquinone biosynthesis C-methylase UbiE